MPKLSVFASDISAFAELFQSIPEAERAAWVNRLTRSQLRIRNKENGTCVIHYLIAEGYTSPLFFSGDMIRLCDFKGHSTAHLLAGNGLLEKKYMTRDILAMQDADGWTVYHVLASCGSLPAELLTPEVAALAVRSGKTVAHMCVSRRINIERCLSDDILLLKNESGWTVAHEMALYAYKPFQKPAKMKENGDPLSPETAAYRAGQCPEILLREPFLSLADEDGATVAGYLVENIAQNERWECLVPEILSARASRDEYRKVRLGQCLSRPFIAQGDQPCSVAACEILVARTKESTQQNQGNTHLDNTLLLIRTDSLRVLHSELQKHASIGSSDISRQKTLAAMRIVLSKFEAEIKNRETEEVSELINTSPDNVFDCPEDLYCFSAEPRIS